jgi:hypothetical protein
MDSLTGRRSGQCPLTATTLGCSQASTPALLRMAMPTAVYVSPRGPRQRQSQVTRGVSGILTSGRTKAEWAECLGGAQNAGAIIVDVRPGSTTCRQDVPG